MQHRIEESPRRTKSAGHESGCRPSQHPDSSQPSPDSSRYTGVSDEVRSILADAALQCQPQLIESIKRLIGVIETRATEEGHIPPEAAGAILQGVNAIRSTRGDL